MIERFGLDGRVCVVTGAGRGIGRGIALGLAAAGAHVVVAARRTREIDAVAHEIEVLGGHAHAVTTDVRREDDNERSRQPPWTVSAGSTRGSATLVVPTSGSCATWPTRRWRHGMSRCS